MPDLKPIETTELEELFQQSIPCHDCGGEAALVAYGHADGPCDGHNDDAPPWFKCIKCYLEFSARVGDIIAAKGSTRHSRCGRTFVTAATLAPFREF